jgi:hypothetical protein
MIDINDSEQDLAKEIRALWRSVVYIEKRMAAIEEEHKHRAEQDKLNHDDMGGVAPWECE